LADRSIVDPAVMRPLAAAPPGPKRAESAFRRQYNASGPRLVALGVGLLLALLTLVPLTILLVGSFRPDGLPTSPGWTLDHYIEVWGSAYNWRLVAITLIFAGCSTLLAVILATGAELRELDIPGAARLKGKGVSHCASCDAPLLRNKTVAVVGGGDSAAQEALTLAEFASRVLILHRGTALSAQHAYRDALAAHPRIELRFETVVEEVLGETGVTGARLRGGTGAAADLELAGIFVYIGLQPNTSFLEGRLALDPVGRIPTDGWMRTELEGICAAGAVRAGWAGRAAISAGDGAMAKLAVDRYLSDDDWRRR
jgi:alkyl hydroperoxide reductase subunit AhpF